MNGTTILITGAAGNMGSMMRTRLAAAGRTLRLLDTEPLTAGPDEEVVTGTVTDRDVIHEACQGVSAVIHLGGIPSEAPFDDILQVNVIGTHNVLEAARQQGVPRVVLASSNHAVGFWSRDDAPADGLPADLPVRPDSYYGWSKAANEAMARMYVDRFGLDVFCLRIGSCFPEPFDIRSLSTWMSPDDGARLMEACLTTPVTGFRLIWGISPNTRRWWSLAAGAEIGFDPVDDSEPWADRMLEEFGEPEPGDPVQYRVGGKFCSAPLGEWMS